MRIDQDLGPAPTPPVPSSLSAARRKVLLVVAGAGERGVTVVQVADELGGHPNGARAHLEALAEDGLVSVENIESGRFVSQPEPGLRQIRRHQWGRRRSPQDRFDVGRNVGQ